MDDDCEWTETLLGHEIIADLESLQGVAIEWEQEWSVAGHRFLVQVATGDGRTFAVDISIAESH